MTGEKKEKAIKFLKKNGLTLGTFLGVLIGKFSALQVLVGLNHYFSGIGLGMGLKDAKDVWSQRQAMYVEFIGTLFLSMLKGIIIPLVVPSLIAAIGKIGELQFSALITNILNQDQ